MFLRSCPETCRLLERQTHVLCRVLCFAAFEVCGKHPSLQILYKYRHAKKYKDSFGSTDVVIVKRCDTVIHQSDRSRWRQWCWKRPSSSQSLTTFWDTVKTLLMYPGILTLLSRAVPLTWTFHCLDSFAARTLFNDTMSKKALQHCNGRIHCYNCLIWYMLLWKLLVHGDLWLNLSRLRLGGLLALGFGEAGAEVIGQNMKAASETWRDVARRGFHASWCCASLWRKALAAFP